MRGDRDPAKADGVYTFTNEILQHRATSPRLGRRRGIMGPSRRRTVEREIAGADDPEAEQ